MLKCYDSNHSGDTVLAPGSRVQIKLPLEYRSSKDIFQDFFEQVSHGADVRCWQYEIYWNDIRGAGMVIQGKEMFRLRVVRDTKVVCWCVVKLFWGPIRAGPGLDSNRVRLEKGLVEELVCDISHPIFLNMFQTDFQPTISPRMGGSM